MVNEKEKIISISPSLLYHLHPLSSSLPLLTQTSLTLEEESSAHSSLITHCSTIETKPYSFSFPSFLCSLLRFFLFLLFCFLGFGPFSILSEEGSRFPFVPLAVTPGARILFDPEEK